MQSRRNLRTSLRTMVGWILLAILTAVLGPQPILAGTDAYYQTLRPQVPPIGRRIPCGSRVGRPQQRVIMADKPRQAALAALENPRLGVEMAGHALAAGIEAERNQLDTSVDLYFETVAFSWNYLRSTGAANQPDYQPAWQLYHYGLHRLIAAGQRFGRLDPSSGLRVVTSTGSLVIPIAYHGFVWRPEDFSRVEVVTETRPRKLRHRYSTPGLGVPLVVIREHGLPAERFFVDTLPFGATAVLRPSLAALAGRAPPMGAPGSHGPLEFYDPLRVSKLQVAGQDVALAGDTSAALEYAVKNFDYSAWQGLIRPGKSTDREKLSMIEPYQRGKHPLVFVHGFFSSPVIWAELANEILADPSLRKRFQLWAFRYPTGRPFLESAASLRRELTAAVAASDPHNQDPAMADMMIIGHSMGGLVSKLVVTSSGDTLWCSVANRPLGQIKATDEDRRRLFELFYFEPLPFVSRVVFMGTPHDGTMLASGSLGRISSHCVQQPQAEVIQHKLLVRNNPGVFSPELEKGIPSSIDLMEPNSGLLKAIQELCPGSRVQLHNIIGTGLPSPLAGAADGVVSVHSAQHPWVSTERYIHTTHGGLHDTDEAVEEIKCIMRRHVWEASEPDWQGVPTSADCPTPATEPCPAEMPCAQPARREHSCLVRPDAETGWDGPELGSPCGP